MGGTAGGYAVDIVLCIDATGSMAPVLSTVKEGARSFHARLETVMAKRDMAVDTMRLRVIAFRDFGADPVNAIELTPFHPLPRGERAVRRFLNKLTAGGGGDIPESGLEALALAVLSPWSRENGGDGRRRHIIAVFTDAGAHPLGKHTPDGDGYPRTLDELHDQWGSPGRDGAVMDQSAKRLLVFAPEAEPWRDIAETWDKTLYVPSVAGTGLEDVALDEIISTITRSL